MTGGASLGDNALRSLCALLPRLHRAARELGLAVAAPEHEQGHEVVGVAEVVAHPHRHLDLVVDGLYAPAADAELDCGRLPRLPVGLALAALAAFHSSRRTASSASFIHWTTWKGSVTHLALGQRRLTSCLIHLAPSAVTTSMARLCSRVSSSRNRLSTSLPVPSCAQMRQPRSSSPYGRPVVSDRSFVKQVYRVRTKRSRQQRSSNLFANSWASHLGLLISPTSNEDPRPAVLQTA